MRGFDMNHLVAPLELLMTPPDLDEDLSELPASGLQLSLPLTTIGIGDGGNEVGMGKIYETITGSSILNAQQIACTVPADHLLVCSVSNWGGYALAAAFSLATREEESATSTEIGVSDTDEEWLERSLPSEEEQRGGCVAMVAAGARDGITKTQELFVDGMPLETSLAVLKEIREIAVGSRSGE
jgi:D-glutamate cyclase